MERKEKIFVANFKSLGVMAQALPLWMDYIRKNQRILSKNNHLIVAPPFLYLSEADRIIKKRKIKVDLAAQDVSQYEPGNHTAKISAPMLKECGVKYVIIGHSETRNENHLTNIEIQGKIQQANKHEIIPIVCVRNILEAKKSIVDSQFNGIVAYEPESAIGTGQPAQPDEVEKICLQIKKQFPKARILYGGSVNGENVGRYINLPSIDGVLIGQKSADPSFFSQIIRASS